MSQALINIDGFESTDPDGRVWNADATLGLIRNDDDTLTLLNCDGGPSNHTLTDDHAAHILRRSAQDSEDADATMRRWDYYASAL